jgi:iron complex outermembrane receptor protein
MQLNRHVKASLLQGLLRWIDTKTASARGRNKAGRARLNYKILAMRMTVVLLTVACLQVSAGGYSQKVSLSVRNQSIEPVFRQIRQQTGYVFWYKLDMIKYAKKVTLHLNNEDLTRALDELFKDQPLSYEIVDRTIVVKLKEPPGITDAVPPPPTVTITGKVTDEKGAPLTGVSIQIKGAKGGVQTGADGTFTMSGVKEDAVLVFSYVGYQAQSVAVNGQKELTIVLHGETQNLGDMVVVGYGRTSRKNLSSAVSTVKPEDLNKGAITDVGQLLQGKVPGLNITASGDPNQPAAVILRGASTLNSSQTPFYVIDGVPGVDISLIAPDDIASIDVQKDAAATAIYGNRAAAGVIIVTTRKGRAGQMLVNYNGYVGTEKVSSRLDVMDANQLHAFMTKNNMALSPADDKGANTDWQKAIERNSALSHNHNISFSGGAGKNSYIASLNYVNKEGILNNSSLQRVIGRLAIEQYALNDKLKFGVNVTNSNSNANDIPYRNTVLLQAISYLPTSPVKNSDGTYFENFTSANYYNPVAMMNHGQVNTKYNNLVGNFTTQAKLPFGLTYDLSLSYINLNTLVGQYLDKYFTNNYTNMYDNPDPALSGHTQQVFGTNGQATRQSFTNTYKILETYFTWNRKFGYHSVNAVLGYSWQDNVIGNGFQATTFNFAVDNTSYNNLSLSNPYAYSTHVNFGTDTYQHTKLISDFARVNYNFQDRYLFQGSIRRDGSSVFGANKQWGYFPSAGAAWRISEESFMKGQNTFSDLKLRGSYGVTGNSSGFSAYTAQLISGNVGSYYYNGNSSAAYGLTQAQNTNLRWEKTATTDIGVDFAVAKGRVSGSVDVYNKNTTGMIWPYAVDRILVPTGTIVANGGSMNNKGIELSLTAQVIDKGDFGWTSTLNLAHNTNKITSMTNPLFSGGDSVGAAYPEGGGRSGSSLQLLKKGHPLGQFYTLQYAGKDTGGVSQFVTRTGKLTTTPTIGTDYNYSGNAQPKLLLGWSNSFRYRNWDLNIFLRGVFGNKIFNATRADLFRPKLAQYGNLLADVKNESTNDYNDYYYSNRFIESGSYLRFDNATLAYNFKDISPYIKKLRVYGSVNNLFVITAYKGVDPEVNQGGIAPGVDYNNFYPKTRTFLVGLNLSF